MQAWSLAADAWLEGYKQAMKDVHEAVERGHGIDRCVAMEVEALLELNPTGE